ncbi:MAG: cytochrome c-type biogenesis protein [Gammaproteobacteria bacterium]
MTPYTGAGDWELGTRRRVAGYVALVLCLVLALLSVPAFAVEAPSGPGVLSPKLELRYQQLASTLRCPVCQNEPIAVSDSRIAADLRRIVREQLLAGKSNAQIRAYMVSRYGLFAVYKPPVERSTWALWFGPLLLLLIALAVAAYAVRRRSVLLGKESHEDRP